MNDQSLSSCPSPRKIEPPGDTKTIRCPRLGHPITFSYCCQENKGSPCFKALDCWFPHFDVAGYFRKKLDAEKFSATFLNRVKPKVMTLVELIEQARRRQQENG